MTILEQLQAMNADLSALSQSAGDLQSQNDQLVKDKADLQSQLDAAKAAPAPVSGDDASAIQAEVAKQLEAFKADLLSKYQDMEVAEQKGEQGFADLLAPAPAAQPAPTPAPVVDPSQPVVDPAAPVADQPAPSSTTAQ